MTRKHREGSGGGDFLLYASVSHHLLRSSYCTEVIAHAELSVPDTEQMLVRARRQPFLAAFVFFLVFFWIGKNIKKLFVPVNTFYFIRIAIVCMTYLFSITTKLFFTVLSYFLR